MPSLTKALRIVEFVSIFCIGPILLYRFRLHIGHAIALIILVSGAGSLLYLIRTPSFDNRCLRETRAQTAHLKPALAIFIVTAGLLVVACRFYAADHYFAFPRQKPLVWFLVMVLYPVLAAYPQELFFRGFFFHRYRTLFPNAMIMIPVNAICFGAAHLYYGNWVAPVLSTVGGFLFAYRYHRCGSLLTVGIEHSIWGNYLFTIGIGWYFYSGSIQ